MIEWKMHGVRSLAYTVEQLRLSRWVGQACTFTESCCGRVQPLLKAGRGVHLDGGAALGPTHKGKVNAGIHWAHHLCRQTQLSCTVTGSMTRLSGETDSQSSQEVWCRIYIDIMAKCGHCVMGTRGVALIASVQVYT